MAYRQAPQRSPTEENFAGYTTRLGPQAAGSSYSHSNHSHDTKGSSHMLTASSQTLSHSGSHLLAAGGGSTAHARSSILSQSGMPVDGGRSAAAERELGPYSHLRARSPTSSQEDPSAATGGASAGMIALVGEKEPDDHWYEGDADKRSYAPSLRGLANIITLLFIACGLLMLFAGYPIIANLVHAYDSSNKGGFNIGGSNGSGQVPALSLASLIDNDTPSSAQTWTNPLNNDKYHLVFSDEFEVEGRTFWEGDDPYWTAVDLWYGGTADYEWYSPENVNTTGGALQILLEERPTHNLNFRSGMIQSWDKFCFQGGYIEWSIMQPGTPETTGYWPAAWLMGNLGRAGYLATTDGMWPYSYQSCDTGIMPNQAFANGSGPLEATQSTAQYADNGQLSKLPGMRTPACTCKGEDHPGPNVNVGRSAPELDCFEAQIQTHDGVINSYASQSLQTAPFDVQYFWGNTTDDITIHDDTTEINTYVGGPYQEAVSSVALNPRRGFENTQGDFITYGIQFDPDWNADGGGQITWFIDGKATWTVNGNALKPSPEMDIGQRTIPTEPMYIIINLGISAGFQPVHFTGDTKITFPAIMRTDYVRVYQKDGGKDRISCDPPDHPTADYIARHADIYHNANLTQYEPAGYKRPKNSYRDGC